MERHIKPKMKRTQKAKGAKVSAKVTSMNQLQMTRTQRERESEKDRERERERECE